MSSISINIREGVIHTGETIADVVKNISHPEKISLLVKVTNLARHIGSSSKKMLDNIKHLPTVGVMKLITLGLAPLAIYDIFVSVFSSIRASTNEKIDVALGVIATVGSLGDTAATTAEGLAGVGAVAIQTLGWLTPLAIVSAALEGVGMILITKSLIETHRFSTLFNEVAALDKPVEDYSLEDFSKARLLVEAKQAQEKTFIGKHFETNSEKLRNRLMAIENEVQEMLMSGDQQLIMEGKRKLQTTMQILSKRMSMKKWSNVLTLLAGAVSFVGLGLLFTPSSPAGFVLLAVSSVISLANFFAGKAITNRFEKDLEI